MTGKTWEIMQILSDMMKSNEVQPNNVFIANSSHPALPYFAFFLGLVFYVKHFNFPTPHKWHFGSQICHETPVVILAALRLLVGVVSNVPVCSSPLSSTPVPHHAINSIKHTCSTSCNQLTYKSQFYFPVPAGSLYHSVWVHASQSLSWSVCILSVSEELRANPFFPVLTAEIQPEPLTQISH